MPQVMTKRSRNIKATTTHHRLRYGTISYAHRESYESQLQLQEPHPHPRIHPVQPHQRQRINRERLKLHREQQIQLQPLNLHQHRQVPQQIPPRLHQVAEPRVRVMEVVI